MFTIWLSDQDDRPDLTGQLSRLFNKDINNGCMPRHKDVGKILKHMLNYHPKAYLEFKLALDKAYKEYVDLSENYKRFGKVEDFTIDFVEGYGWGLFKGEDLMSNYPIEAKNRPKKRNLLKIKKVETNPFIGKSIIPFGKHNGKSLNSILKEDKGYLVWMYDNFKFYPNQNWLKLEIANLLKLS
jgi:hypothetical protein